MSLRSLLVINAIALGGCGAGAVLIPGRVSSLFGIVLSREVLLMTQYAGLGSLTIALVAWFSRNVKDPKAMRAIIQAFLITYIVGAIISVFGTISGVMKTGWPIIGIYTLLAIGYGYFLLKRRRSSS